MPEQSGSDAPPARISSVLRSVALDPRDAPPPDMGREPEGFVVEVGAERIHFLDWGGPATSDDRQPAVLLIHGIGQTAWTWAPVARRLAPLVRVVAMDLRGHGLSDSPVEGYEPHRLAEDAIAVIEGANIDRVGVVLAGHGFGGAVATWAAGALGDRAAGLVLVDGGWEDVATSSGMTPEEWLPGLDEPPEVLRTLRAFLTDRHGFDPASWDADQERAARATVVEVPAGHVVPATRPHALAGTVRAMFAYRPSALDLVATRIVALVAGDPEGERLAALDDTARARAHRAAPPIEVATFPAAGHNLMRYQPSEVTAAILRLAGTIAL